MTTTQEPTRREQILATAAELFAARGFHGVSVAELGAACGISGPALYKHFPSKQAMLAEMLVSISEQLLAVGRERVATADGPADAVRALVGWHVEFALGHRPLIIVQDRDWESLPEKAREQVRRLQRSYVDLLAGQLRAAPRRISASPPRTPRPKPRSVCSTPPRAPATPSPTTRCGASSSAMALAALGAAP